MSRKWAFILAGALIGWVLGLSVGVAFEGDAVNGAFVFAPLGGLLGWFAQGGSTDEELDSAEVKSNGASVDDPGNSVRSSTGSKRSEKLPEAILFAVFAILVSTWNFQMYLVTSAGLMPMLRRNPWVLVVLPFIIALIAPLYAAVYIALGLAAMSFGAKSSNDFKAHV